MKPKICPWCHSKNWKKIATNREGYSYALYLLGRLLLLGEKRSQKLGLIGKKRRFYICEDCHREMKI